VTSEKTKRDQPPERTERHGRNKEVRSLDVWARSAPIRLAGYEDDPTESHILRGID
jgi:hypothetical protein